MAPPILLSEPASVNAGDTVKWLKSLADYPAGDGWTLAYTLINSASKIEFSTTAQGDYHLVNVARAVSALWVAGNYDFRGIATLGADSFTVTTGRIKVNAVFTAATLDARSQMRRTLEAIESTLEGRATSATAEYEIAGRKLKYIPIPELLVLRDRMRADVRNEDAAAAVASGAANPGRIFVRFGP